MKSIACVVVLGLFVACGDEGSPVGTCADGNIQNCKMPDGADGQQTCSGGYWGTCQEKSCTEGATLPCTQNDGKPGQKVCSGGKWTACGPIPGQCQDGTMRNCTTGDNKPGLQKCVNGNWGNCELINQPACKDGQKQACSTKCGTGTEICLNGVWQNCDAPKPAQEVCDGYDNNCDGQIDEVCMCIHGKCEPCYTGPVGTENTGQCKPGQRCCDKGQWSGCTGEVLPAASESCTDAVDNDCNGTVNDGCVCTVGQQQPCGSDVGECKKGTQMCELKEGGNPQWGVCVNSVAPALEAPAGCDGKDQDCDGVIDNNLSQDLEEVNDTCNQSRHKYLDDDAVTKMYTATVYPKGDVDYYRISLQEVVWVIYPNPCICPLPPFICNPDPQCMFLEVELVQPVGAGVTYEATVLNGSCGSPTKTTKTTGKTTVKFDGVCGYDDSRDVWIKVAPKAGSNPDWSCKPYQLKVNLSKENQAC